MNESNVGGKFRCFFFSSASLCYLCDLRDKHFPGWFGALNQAAVKTSEMLIAEVAEETEARREKPNQTSPHFCPSVLWAAFRAFRARAMHIPD
jgi:hypothetical protein